MRSPRPGKISLLLLASACLSVIAAARPSCAEDAPSAGAIRNALHQAAPALFKDPLLLEQVIRGFQIAPVRLDIDRLDPVLVGYGSYIVNAVAGCNDCHTNPSYAVGGDPFLGQKKQVNKAGYLGGGQAFGPFISRNLTPEDGLPAGRTYAQFVQIMRTGVDLDHIHPQVSPLLQVMPWPTYQSMTDFELKAIYSYLSAIPPLQPPGG